ncbi:P-loop containing nucleoside triphosphate hydrolase protein [Trichoderma velutinum]
MVVVGDQSAGKSSVLNALTGFQFPRSATLCTRHATEIVYRRESTESAVVSIIPHNPSPEHEKLVNDFRRSTYRILSGEFPKIFKDAAKVMGIKLSENDGDRGSAFSLDVLKIEISGPNVDNLTVIDVPGVFETATPGLTTESDIDLVKNIVKRYVYDSRAVILAVVPCNGDIANQKILQLAAEADPQGQRTLGILTKPDLAVENAAKAAICDLVNGERRDLPLGYHVVENLGADDISSIMDNRHQQGPSLLGQAPWNTIIFNRLGVSTLRFRIKNLLMERARAEFPVVESEIMANLKKSRGLLADMGEPFSPYIQRAYVAEVAWLFEQTRKRVLDAYFADNQAFDDPATRLVTQIRTINEAFSRIMLEKGHAREFYTELELSATENQPENHEASAAHDGLPPPDRSSLYDGKIHFEIPTAGQEDLGPTVSNPYRCSKPEVGGILEHIQRLCTIARSNGSRSLIAEILPLAFKEQAKKWRSIAYAHVSNAVLIVHHFIRQTLEKYCSDVVILEKLWAFLLHGHYGYDGLRSQYGKAMQHISFLLSVEFGTRAITYDLRFEEKFNQLKPNGQNPGSQQCDGSVPEQQPTSSLEETVVTIHNAVCQQAIDYYLLHAMNGPLTVLTDNMILEMTAERLETIAGDDPAVKEKKKRLTKEIESLMQAARF